jgi:uncharacterized protein (TIGR02145 family)
LSRFEEQYNSRITVMKILLNTCILLFLSVGLLFLNDSCTRKSDPLVLKTADVSAITQTGATSGGIVSKVNDKDVLSKGVCWSTEINPTAESNRTKDGARTGNFVSTLTGLVPGTTYYVKAYIVAQTDTIYGNSVSFQTQDFGTVTDFDGNVYKTIDMGTQTWMAQNLSATRFNDGKVIPLVKDTTAWSKLSGPGYCWYKNEEASFKEEYGALYNWHAVNTGKLCPDGWHIPTDEEFTLLSDYLGGETVAGGKMKVTGLTYWVDPNTGADNSSGFSALPGGFRYFDGKFFDFGFSGYWWTSTQYDPDPSVAWFRFLYYNESTLFRFNNQKRNGFSVRCIKNKVQ